MWENEFPLRMLLTGHSILKVVPNYDILNFTLYVSKGRGQSSCPGHSEANRKRCTQIPLSYMNPFLSSNQQMHGKMAPLKSSVPCTEKPGRGQKPPDDR